MNKRPKVLILTTVAAIGTVLNTILLIVLLAMLRHQAAVTQADWSRSTTMPQALAGPFPELDKFVAADRKFRKEHGLK